MSREARYEEVYRVGALLRAFEQARKAKRGKGGEPAFYWRLEENLWELSCQLRERAWEPDPYRYFWLVQGKKRLVSEASFRDRVVHHALVRVLEPLWEPRFHPHSYASRVGRGTHKAVHEVQRLSRRYKYCLRLDVLHYFDQINHEVLYGLLGEVVRDEGVLWLCRRLMEGTRVPGVEAGRGLPIGNLTSQFWANVYLDRVDHRLSSMCGGYVRYMDDMALFGDDKDMLWEACQEAHSVCGELALTLKHSATFLSPTRDGVAWLGLRVYPRLVRLQRAARQRLGRKLRVLAAQVGREGEASERQVMSADSLLAHARGAQSWGLRRAWMEGGHLNAGV